MKKRSVADKPEIRAIRSRDIERKYKPEDFKKLDKESLEEAKKEWSVLSLKETDQFLCFHSRILRQAKPIGHFEVFLEVRFCSKRICDISIRCEMEEKFNECIDKLNFQYLPTDYEYLKEQEMKKAGYPY